MYVSFLSHRGLPVPLELVLEFKQIIIFVVLFLEFLSSRNLSPN